MKEEYYKLVKHYEHCLESHGDTHLGVDWPNPEGANLRYEIMIDIIRLKKDSENEVTLLDFGCGTAHLLEFIQKKGYNKIQYSGLDISSKFVTVAGAKFPNNSFYCIDILEDHKILPQFDYLILNGVFTEKRELNFDDMWAYFIKMLPILYLKSKKGFAFNVMSKIVDWERDDLFHVSFDLLSEFLCKNITRNFVIRNDYGLYEYSVYVFK